MAIALNDFLKTANDEQKRVIKEIKELAFREGKAHKGYMEQQRAIDKEVSIIEHHSGLQSDLIEADLELIVDPMLPERDAYLTELKTIQKELKELFLYAVYEWGMNHVGLIQRNYERVVGEPLPENPNQYAFTTS